MFLVVVKNAKCGYLYVSFCAAQNTVIIKTLFVATAILFEQDN